MALPAPSPPERRARVRRWIKRLKTLSNRTRVTRPGPSPVKAARRRPKDDPPVSDLLVSGPRKTSPQELQGASSRKPR